LAACKSNDCESCDSHVDFYVCRTDDDGCTDNYYEYVYFDYFNNDVFYIFNFDDDEFFEFNYVNYFVGFGR
jgi:hypothetical protein